MNVEEFVGFVNNNEDKEILVDLQGIINLKMKINHVKGFLNQNQLFLEDTNNKNNKISFNLNQLMKITKINDCKILLEFDQLQIAYITINFSMH